MRTGRYRFHGKVGHLFGVALLAVSVVLIHSTIAKAPKKKDTPETVNVALPSDLNLISLRVGAAEVLYELDLSPVQLRAVRDAAAGSATTGARTPAHGDQKLIDAFKALYDSVLKAEDRDKVAQLRDTLGELQDDDAVHLDDEVRVSDAARAKVPDLLRQIKASQVAAYLADHADQVGDPVERMMDTLADVRDPSAEEPDAEIQAVSEEVGTLVAGLDAANAKQVAEEVTDWLRANRRLTDAEFATRRTNLEDSAHKIIGDITALQVLNHWVENELAMLLSNSELPGAIEATLSARTQAE